MIKNTKKQSIASAPSTSHVSALTTGSLNAYQFGEYRTFDICSTVTGANYQIFLWVPEGEVPDTGFPVLYVLDGNAEFLTVAETVRRVSRKPTATGIGPSIVIGIGYPRTSAYNMARRQFDMTLDGPANGDAANQAEYGGQAGFIRFLADQVIPYVEAEYPADPTRRTLLGHSMAGYFALEVLACRPDLFSAYVAFSPSIWWDCDGLRARLNRHGSATLDARLYLAVGRYEQEPAPWSLGQGQGEDYHSLRALRRMIDNTRLLTEDLQSLAKSKDSVRFELGDEEDHGTIVTTFLCRALRFAQPFDTSALAAEAWLSHSPR